MEDPLMIHDHSLAAWHHHPITLLGLILGQGIAGVRIKYDNILICGFVSWVRMGRAL